MRLLILSLLLGMDLLAAGQLNWINVDSLFGPLPQSLHVYRTESRIGDQPNIAYYVVADLRDKNLDFFSDTTYRRRLTPTQFYAKNAEPLVVVNTSFFSFQTHQNLNLIVKDDRIVAYNNHNLAGRGKDTLTWRHPLGSALGIDKKRRADIAWLYTDSSLPYAFASQVPVKIVRDSMPTHDLKYYKRVTRLKKWKMKEAVGGGPVLLQNGEIKITNNEELKFAGKAIDDRHPRTAMGYTADQKLIILAVQGRMPGTAAGATLTDLALILKDLGCVEALNLDGGGSSCLLVNGHETIKPSDKEGQRAVPGVFVIGNSQW